MEKVNSIGKAMMNIWKTTAKKNKINIKVFGIPTLENLPF